MAGERRETDFMNRSLDEIAAEMDSSLYDRDERDGHHRPQHRYSPYPADHVPSWRAEKEGGNGVGGGGAASGGDGNRVFVANLNYTVTWQQVKDLLKTAGSVLKCDLFKNADGSSRGMGLVLFADRESADRAVRELNGTELDGRKIFLRKDMRVEDRERAGITPSNPKLRPPPNPSATIFVANLDYSLTWQKLRDIFRVAGKIVHVDMLADPDGRPKGCASIQFETTSDAMNAIILFHGQLLQNRPMVVRMDSKSPIQPDPIQLKLQVGKGGMRGGGGGGGGAGILSSRPHPSGPPLMGGAGGAPAGLAGNIPLSPSFSQSLSSSPLSPSLTGQLPLLAALGLSALSNLRHFSPEQLALLGINPGHLGGGGGGGGRGKMVGNGGRGSSGWHRGPAMPPLPEHGQEGLLSQFPFDAPGGGALMERERSLPPLGSSLGRSLSPPSLRLRPHPPNSAHYSATMATDLSLATALAAPPHPSSLLYRHEPLGSGSDGIGGRKGKKLFVRNLHFGTTWQTLKDYMKAAGPINYVDVLKNEDGRSRGCAAVVFDRENDAERAIRLFDQSELDGRRISVTFDRAN